MSIVVKSKPKSKGIFCQNVELARAAYPSGGQNLTTAGVVFLTGAPYTNEGTISIENHATTSNRT